MPEKWPIAADLRQRLSEIKPSHNRQGSTTIEEKGGDQDDKVQPELETEHIAQFYSDNDSDSDQLESDKTLSQLSRRALSQASELK